MVSIYVDICKEQICEESNSRDILFRNETKIFVVYEEGTS